MFRPWIVVFAALSFLAVSACRNGDAPSPDATAQAIGSPTIDPSGGPRISARPLSTARTGGAPSSRGPGVLMGPVLTAAVPTENPAVAAQYTAVANVVNTQIALVATLNAGRGATATPARRSGGGSSSVNRAYPRDVWQGAYYNNARVNGSPAMVRRDGAIEFDWGEGAPAPGINANDFSVRWQRTIAGDSGVYRIRAITDDGVRVKVDGDALINDFTDGPKDLSADIGLTRRDHQVQVDYFEKGGTARARVWIERTHEPRFPDWRADYYNNITLAGDPVLIRNEKSSRLSWGTSGPDEAINPFGFSLRLQKRVDFERGEYEFRVRADDGVRLWVGDDLLIDRWHASDGKATYTASKRLNGDEHVRIEYFNGHHRGMLNVSWSGTSDDDDGGGGSDRTNTPAAASSTPSATAASTAAPSHTPAPSPSPSAGPSPETATPSPAPTDTETPAPPDTETPTPSPTTLRGGRAAKSG
jgi:hypothetical protein